MNRVLKFGRFGPIIQDVIPAMTEPSPPRFKPVSLWPRRFRDLTWDRILFVPPFMDGMVREESMRVIQACAPGCEWGREGAMLAAIEESGASCFRHPRPVVPEPVRRA